MRTALIRHRNSKEEADDNQRAIETTATSNRTLADYEVNQLEHPLAASDARVAVQASLATFMHLPVAQRSCVVLVDVLGHSAKDVSTITRSSVAAVKAALHRGRARGRRGRDAPHRVSRRPTAGS